MNILLIDHDEDFRKRLSDYLASGLSGIVLISVSSLGQLHRREEKAEEADLILIEADEQAILELKQAGVSDRIVVLDSGEMDGFSVRSDGIRCIDKYQRVSGMISSVAELSEAAGTAFVRRNTEDMEIVCITGFPGGCGRTSLSMMYARILKREKNRNPLVLPAGRFSSLNEYFRNDQTKADFNLFLLSLTSGFRVVPQRFLIEDDYGVHAFVSPETGCDIVDLSREDVVRLSEEIRSWGMFDSLVLDVNPQSDPVSRYFVQMADQVLILHDERRGLCQEERMWMNHLQKSVNAQMYHVMNHSASGGLYGEIYLNEEEENPADPEFLCRIPEDSGSFFFRDGIREMSLSGNFAGCVGMIAERMGNG